MELKAHQEAVLADLWAFLNHLDGAGGISPAFRAHWLAKGAGRMPPYRNTLPGVPHVCVKVPTGGGKTLIAAAALSPLFAWACPEARVRPRVAVWLAPSLTIVDQTLRALRDPAHPYRRRLTQDFTGRVEVYDKEALLQGAGLSPDAIREQLTIVVLSYDSLKSRNKDNRKLHQENGRLLEFKHFPGVDVAEGEEAPSAFGVLQACAPVVVVDESHNATTPLTRDMLGELRPSFVLDLTATPRPDANIISYVDAMALKHAGMVKLPVIVRNRPDKETVYTEAIDLQRRLEAEALAEEARSGRYIRPIVLFQAENQLGIETYKRVGKTLEGHGVPAAEIAIKTGDLDEIKGMDLLAKGCAVRFIITVNALKEGWDCPFAYVLASLADRSSPVEVEQILGRVLRQPHARPVATHLLNYSYVLTASDKFHTAIKGIVDGLKKAGFSERDYRVVEAEGEEEQPSPGSLFSATSGNRAPARQSPPSWYDDAVREGMAFERMAADTVAQDLQPPEVEAAMNRKAMREPVREAAMALHLPQFILDIPRIGLLADHGAAPLLERENLLSGFRLGTADAAIGFDALEDPIVEVDIEESDKGSRPHVRTLDVRREQVLADFIRNLSHDAQVQQMTGRLYQLVGRLPPIPDQDIKAYIRRILDNMPAETLHDSIARPRAYGKRIQEKIKALTVQHARQEFEILRRQGKIAAKPTWRLPATIAPTATAAPYDRRLYEDEWGVNGLEERAIRAICGLDNLVFWHRNPSQIGFRINGAINHFPDFILLLHSGRVVLLETKGGDRDNSDSTAKLELGRTWASEAGPQYRYFMVFEENGIPGALRLDELAANLREM
ncbi:MAG: DEAD/DEAH box helicase family protein [Candidatus Zixiibacteriota bacterium]